MKRSEWRAIVPRALKAATLRNSGGLLIRYLPDGTGTPDHAPRDSEGLVAIILEKQFSDLRVGESAFSVNLWFTGSPATITVPYEQVVTVEDREASVGIMFAGKPKAVSVHSDTPPSTDKIIDFKSWQRHRADEHGL